MMVQRRHAKDPPAGQLERGHLQNHRHRFHHEHPAHHEQHQFLAYRHGNDAQRGTQGQRADITHEYLGRVGVEPEKTEAGTDHRATEHRNLPHARHMRNTQIIGEDPIARGITEHRQGAGHHGGRHDRQPIQAIGQIDGVAGTDDDEVG